MLSSSNGVRSPLPLSNRDRVQDGLVHVPAVAKADVIVGRGSKKDRQGRELHDEEDEEAGKTPEEHEPWAYPMSLGEPSFFYS